MSAAITSFINMLMQKLFNTLIFFFLFFGRYEDLMHYGKMNDSEEYMHFKYKEQDVACSYTKEIKEL